MPDKSEVLQALNGLSNDGWRKMLVFALFLKWAHEMQETVVSPEDLDFLIQYIAQTPSMRSKMAALCDSIKAAYETAPNASTDQSNA